MERAGKGMIAVCFFIMLCGIAYAQVPEMMTWSGPVPRGSVAGDGSYEITFVLYAGEVADVPLWSEVQSVQVTGGMVAVNLGAVNPLTVPFDRPYWIGVKIDGIEQREPLTSVGYAFRCREAETIAGTAADTREAETASGITPKVVSPDEVLSANIKEADGTTGQNTNIGSQI